ncbi:MAG: hypothetical protein V8Q57_00380 [Blautia sp.]
MVTMAYESKLFDTDEIMDVDILMDEDDWQECWTMLFLRNTIPVM